MNPPACFCFGNALHTMNSAFKPKIPKHIWPRDSEDDFLKTAFAGRIRIHHVDFHSVRLSVTRIHSKEIPSKKCRFFASCSGTYFNDNISRRVGISPRKQLFFKLLFQPGTFCQELIPFFSIELLRFSIFGLARRERLRFLDLLLKTFVRLKQMSAGAEPSQLFRAGLIARRVLKYLRVCKL